MGTRLTAVLAAVLALTLAAAALAAAAMIGIYHDGMGTDGQRRQMVKVSGARCRADGLGKALRVTIGKRTRECGYRTPVLGRQLEIAATERLLGSTPPAARHKAFLAVNLRGEGARAGYQLAVYPLQRKVQLREVLANGQVKYLAIERDVATVKGLDEANQLRLRATDLGAGGGCQLLAFVGGKLVAEATDEAAGELQGRFSGFSVGAAAKAKGIAASIDDVVLRVPSPF
jgi:hypothetical protein